MDTNGQTDRQAKFIYRYLSCSPEDFDLDLEAAEPALEDDLERAVPESEPDIIQEVKIWFSLRIFVFLVGYILRWIYFLFLYFGKLYFCWLHFWFVTFLFGYIIGCYMLVVICFIVQSFKKYIKLCLVLKINLLKTFFLIS